MYPACRAEQSTASLYVLPFVAIWIVQVRYVERRSGRRCDVSVACEHPAAIIKLHIDERLRCRVLFLRLEPEDAVLFAHFNFIRCNQLSLLKIALEWRTFASVVLFVAGVT